MQNCICDYVSDYECEVYLDLSYDLVVTLGGRIHPVKVARVRLTLTHQVLVHTVQERNPEEESMFSLYSCYCYVGLYFPRSRIQSSQQFLAFIPGERDVS